MVLWIILGVVAVIILGLAGLEIAVKITKKRSARYSFQDLKVTDVTSRNKDGTKRQEILGKIANKDREFRRLRYEIRQYKNRDEDAYGVFVNEHQIGNITRDDVPTLLEIWDRIDRIFYVNAYAVKGGKSYGADVKLKLK